MALTTDPEVMRSRLATDIYAVHGRLTPPDKISTPPKISVPSCSPPLPKKFSTPPPEHSSNPPQKFIHFPKISQLKKYVFSSFYFFGKQEIAICINLQLPIVSFKKSYLLDIHHHKTYVYINFQQNWANRSVITVNTNLFAKKNTSCQNLSFGHQYFFFKSTISDMHPRKTYMYNNFQQNRISRSVKSVHTNFFAIFFYLHKFGTCN